MVFPLHNEECLPIKLHDTWSFGIQAPMKFSEQGAIIDNLTDLGAHDDYYFDTSPVIAGDIDHMMAEPKKARRQAQNRAA